jgi:hypothetical protein
MKHTSVPCCSHMRDCRVWPCVPGRPLVLIILLEFAAPWLQLQLIIRITPPIVTSLKRPFSYCMLLKKRSTYEEIDWTMSSFWLIYARPRVDDFWNRYTPSTIEPISMFYFFRFLCELILHIAGKYHSYHTIRGPYICVFMCVKDL